MKCSKYFALVPALAILASVPLSAQDGKDGKGGTVAERSESEVFRLPVYVKAPIGALAVVANTDEVPLGVVRDHVIDHRTGKVLYVAVGGVADEERAARLVPYERFTFDAELQRLVLPLSAEQLAALPEYDPKGLALLAERHELARARSEPKIEDEDVGKQGDDPALQEAALVRKKDSLIASSKFLDGPIMAMREPFADAQTLVLEPNEGIIAFVLAGNSASKADPYVVPWKAMRWNVPEPKPGDDPRDSEEETRGNFVIETELAALADAPKLERGDTAHLKDRDTLVGICRYYKVTPPLRMERKADRESKPRG